MPWSADHGRIGIVVDSRLRSRIFFVFKVSRIEVGFMCMMVVSRSWMR